MTMLVRVMALPVVIVVAVVLAVARCTRAVWSARYAWSSSMACRHCRSTIALVRSWRCGCGFTYVGSILRQCPVCFARPVMVRCEQCGMTWRVR